MRLCMLCCYWRHDSFSKQDWISLSKLMFLKRCSRCKHRFFLQEIEAGCNIGLVLIIRLEILIKSTPDSCTRTLWPLPFFSHAQYTVWVKGCDWIYLFVCMYVCMYCMYVFMYVCMVLHSWICIVYTGKNLLQVTYVTMVPWGNETLRHHASGTPSAWPALNLLCNLSNGRARRHRRVTSETRKHKSTCGKAGVSLKSWRTALARMPEVWQRDAASRSLKEPWLHT